MTNAKFKKCYNSFSPYFHESFHLNEIKCLMPLSNRLQNKSVYIETIWNRHQYEKRKLRNVDQKCRSLRRGYFIFPMIEINYLVVC